MAFTHSLIASSTVGAGGVSSVVFNNIPQNYTDLIIKTSSRTNRSDTKDSLKLTFNGNATSYSARGLGGNGSSSYSFTNGGTASIEDAIMTVGNTATASTFGNGEIYIPNYISSNSKSISTDSVSENNATAANTQLYAGLWSVSTTVTSITLAPTYGSTILENSTFYLYGIRAGEY